MIGAIILAAGRSRRMGTQKVLLPFRGATILEHIVDQLLKSRTNAVYVVVGYRGDRIRAALAGRPVSIVDNPDHDAGMLSSVRCGVKALPEECEAFGVALGDQPRVTTTLFDQLLDAFTSSERGIVVPLHDGRRGHPIVVAARYRPEILDRYDGVGLRGLLRAHPDDVFELPVPQAWVLSDMDLPEDYEREREGAEG
jgi:molybdenum cofactor cytidylyltransferase